MNTPERRAEIPPQANIAAGLGIGLANGLIISIPVSAELNETSQAHTEATEQHPLPVIDTIDPAVLPLTMTVGMVIGGMIGAIKARVESRGGSFFKS